MFLTRNLTCYYLISLCSHTPAERKLVPSVSDLAVPTLSTEVQPPPRSSIPTILSHTLPHSTVPKWVSVPLLLQNDGEQSILCVNFQDL